MARGKKRAGDFEGNDANANRRRSGRRPTNGEVAAGNVEPRADPDAREGEQEGAPLAAHGPDAGEIARRRFLSIARRRAAHFAHFNEGEDAADGGAARGDSEEAVGEIVDERGEVRDETIGVANAEEQAADGHGEAGGISGRRRQHDGFFRGEEEGGGGEGGEDEEEDWPGPFATARRLVQGRAAAAAAREEGRGDAKKAKESIIVDWKPSRASGTVLPGELPGVPRLYHLCLKLVAENVEHLESLEGVPDAVRRDLGERLSERRRLDGRALGLLLQGTAAEVSVGDCSLVSEADFIEAMAKCDASRMEAIELGLCGRCLSDRSITATIATASNSLPNLTSLSLKGAYRVSDDGLSSLLASAPNLKKLELHLCSLISASGLSQIAKFGGESISFLSLDGCGQLEHLSLANSLQNMKALERLSLERIEKLTDDSISNILATIGPNLKELNLNGCSQLTNKAAAAVGAFCPNLTSLNLGNIPNLKDAALAHVADGCRSLSYLNLRRGGFSDSAIAAFITASGSCLQHIVLNSVRKAGDLSILTLANHARTTLEELDISWCRDISDNGLGFLADSCSRLHTLRIFGCTQVTKLFLKGHSNSNLRVRGISTVSKLS